MCQGFDGLGFREHAGLPGEKGLDAGAQARPIALGEIELAAEVEQGDLEDLFAGAFETTILNAERFYNRIYSGSRFCG